MALTTEQKHRARRIFFKLINAAPDHWGKSLLNDTADAILTWKDANAVAFNAVLPIGFTGAGSTTNEKAAAFIAVLAAERNLEM